MFRFTNPNWLVAFFGLLMAALVACTPASGGRPRSVPAGSTATPTASLGIISAKADVANIEMRMLESFPVQIHVAAKGYFRDGCTKIDQVSQEREGNKFLVTITTARPAEAMCTQAIVPFEEVIRLDVVGLKAGAYTVDINGVTDSFVLDVDNVLPSQ